MQLINSVVMLQTRTLLEDKKSVSSSKAIETGKLFYSACVNTTSLNSFKSAPLWNALVQLGGWPLLTYDKNYDSLDFTTVLAQIKQLYDVDVFVSLVRSMDIKNGSRNIYYIDQADLGLGSGTRSYYLNDTLYSRQMIAYKKYAVDVINTLSRDFQLRILPQTLAELNEIFEFERLLAKAIIPREEIRNISMIYNKMTLKEIQEKMPFINWMSYFRIILPDDVFTFVTQPNFAFIVKLPVYLERIQKLFVDSNKRTLINYMMWILVKTYSRFLDSRFDDINQVTLIETEAQLEKEKPPRWKYCLYSIVTNLDMAVGALYGKEHFSKKDKNEALSMINNLQTSFKEMVRSLDWMDDVTKTSAVDKVNSMLINVGYPDFVVNDTALDAYYGLLQLLQTDSFFDVMQKVNVWHRRDDFNQIMSPFNRLKWDFSPAFVNALYSPIKNSITFPAAILQPPFFKHDLPKSVNYGAMGSVIGHEITHGFDYSGSQFDKSGVLNNWWTSTVFEKFKNKTQCYVNQYSNYIVDDINKNISGVATLNENIADNGGLKESFNVEKIWYLVNFSIDTICNQFQAYRRFVKENGKEEQRLPGLLDLTNDQIFFLSFANWFCGNTKQAQLLQMVLADVHSPDEYRVNGAVSNYDEFAKTFNCPAGTNMNPNVSTRQKCTLW